MESKRFNPTILRKIREKIISVLKQSDVELQKHYQLSSINELSPSFTLTPILRSPTPQSTAGNTSRIKKVLTEFFEETITFQELTSPTFRINALVYYEKELGIVQPVLPAAKKTADVSDQESDIDNIRPKNLDKRKTFLKWVYWLIADKFFNGQEYDAKITKYNGNKDVALFFPPENIVYQVVDYFVFKGINVIPTKDKGVIIYKGDIPDRKERDVHTAFKTEWEGAKKYLEFFNELLRQIVFFIRAGGGGEPVIKSLTFISEAATQGIDHQFQFQFDDQELANTVACTLNDLVITAEKVGYVVTLTVNKNTQLQTISTRWADYKDSAKKHKKGFVIGAGEESEEGAGKKGHMILRLSSDYSQFHYLPFNREIIESHVDDLAKSIDEFGFLDFVLVARTDVVDGIKKDWIVDRQHRFEALKRRKRPIPYSIIHVHSKTELVRLIAVLNSKSRHWQQKDYLRAWSTLKMEEYKIIEEWKTKLPIKIICQAMTGLDPKTVTEKFQQGNIRFREEGKKILNELLLLKTHLPKGVRALTAAIKFLYKMHAGKECINCRD